MSSPESSGCSAPGRRTPSAPTGGWRSRTTCASCAPGCSGSCWCSSLAFIVALFFYDQLLDLVTTPTTTAVDSSTRTPTVGDHQRRRRPAAAAAEAVRPGRAGDHQPVLALQIWAFIVPGLHPHEKRWTRIFAAIAGPLFLVGVALGYYVLPKGLEVLIGFTPVDLTNLVDFSEYFSFMTRMLLVFGIAFEIPFFVVLLNLAGRRLRQGAGTLPAVDHHRHLRLRRRRDPVDRPVLDADAGDPDDGAVHGLRGHRPARRPAAKRAGRRTPGSPTTRPRRSTAPTPSAARGSTRTRTEGPVIPR